MSEISVKQFIGRAQVQITVTNRQLPDITGDALAALAQANGKGTTPRLFDKAGILVRLNSVNEVGAMIEPLNADSLRGELARCADWFRLKGKDDKSEPIAVSP